MTSQSWKWKTFKPGNRDLPRSPHTWLRWTHKRSFYNLTRRENIYYKRKIALCWVFAKEKSGSYFRKLLKFPVDIKLWRLWFGFRETMSQLLITHKCHSIWFGVHDILTSDRDSFSLRSSSSKVHLQHFKASVKTLRRGLQSLLRFGSFLFSDRSTTEVLFSRRSSAVSSGFDSSIVVSSRGYNR